MTIHLKDLRPRGRVTAGKGPGTGRWAGLVLGGLALLLGVAAYVVITRGRATDPDATPIAPAIPPATAAPLTAEDVAQFLDDALGRQMAAQHIPAAAVVVVKDGEQLVAKGYTSRGLEEQQLVGPGETIFLTGSTGKVFVWTAVMQLVEQGKLDLDADVNEYLDFQIPATYPEPITLRHLMSHSAGFDEQFYIYARDPAALEPFGQVLARAIPARVRPPGEMSAYSNYGAALAGYLVERASGQSFESYVEEHLFTPLGMDSTTFRQPPPPALAARRIPSYAYEENAFHALPPKYIRIPATGASATTVADMANFMIAHLEGGAVEQGRILQEDTVARMHSRLFSHDPRVNGFAHGVAETTYNEQRLLRHEGEVPGRGCSALMLIPAERLGFYVTYNGMCGTNTGTEIWQQLLDRYFPPPATALASRQPTSSTNLQALAGSYRSSRSPLASFGKSIVMAGGAYGDIRVTVMGDGSLRTEGLGPAPLAWVEVEPYLFRPAPGNHTIYGGLLFQRGASDRAPRLLVENVPYRAWEQVAWYQSVQFGLLLAGLCAVVLLSAPLVLGVDRARRWRSPAGVHPAPALRWTRRLAAMGAMLYILFIPLFLLVGFEAMEYGVTTVTVLVLSLPMLASGLMLGSLLLAARGWRDQAWGGIPGQVHYVTVLLAAMAFSLWLNSWNLFGFRF
jgi:CubicO group peptidase (beta-lactamase class C family)